MFHNSHSLWPADLQSDIDSPREILEGQAHVVREQTSGNLTADVRVIHDECEQRITLCLDMVGPGVGNRHRIMTVSHSTHLMYPCIVQAQAELADPLAYSDNELRDIIRQILQSREMRGLASSLIVKARQSHRARPAMAEPSSKKRRALRPAWAGVGPEEEEEAAAVAMLWDEPQAID